MIPSLQIRQILFLLLIFSLFGLIFWNLSTFVPALMGAYTLYVLLRHPTLYLSETRKWNKNLSVSVMILLSLTVIFLPLQAFVQVLGTQLVAGFNNSEQIVQSVESVISNIETRLGMDIVTPDRIKSASEWGIQECRGILNATLFGFLQLLIAYFLLWFLLTGGKPMEQSFFNWLPLKNENIEFVRRELNSLVYSNAIGIPLMGIVQAMAGLLGYWIAGVEDLWFWVLITFVAGMIPFLGVLLAFFPLAMVLFSKGMNTQAIFILVYGFVVIGSVDNLARMWLLKKIGHTHPLITLFGVIVGLKLFGFVGFIFGPIMIAMFLLLVKIYVKEFK